MSSLTQSEVKEPVKEGLEDSDASEALEQEGVVMYVPLLALPL